jgi:putative ABC transport system permease protein
MISLAGRDILHSWSKFVLTGFGLGLLIGVTLSMAGIYRGMVDDARVLLDNSGADLWVVQKDTQGPYAESSSLRDDTYRTVRGMDGVARAANVTYFTMQVRRGDTDVRAMVVGFRTRTAGGAGLLGGGAPHHAQPLRGGGRRQDRASSSATRCVSAGMTTRWSA